MEPFCRLVDLVGLPQAAGCLDAMLDEYNSTPDKVLSSNEERFLQVVRGGVSRIDIAAARTGITMNAAYKIRKRLQRRGILEPGKALRAAET